MQVLDVLMAVDGPLVDGLRLFGHAVECVPDDVEIRVATGEPERGRRGQRDQQRPAGHLLDHDATGMIEGHAPMDEVAGWYPVAGGALEAWSVESLDERSAGGLAPVPEASVPCDRWLRSDVAVVRQLASWTATRPRPMGIMAWTRCPPI